MIFNFNDFLNENRVVNFDSKFGNFVMVIGSPGGGKSFFSNNFINLTNYKYFNVDSERELVAKKLGLDLSKPEDNEEILKHTYNTNDERNRTIKNLNTLLKNQNGELPNIIFDTVGNHLDIMKNVINLATDAGYNTTLIYVKTTIENALKRNSQRQRRLGDDVVMSYYNKADDAYGLLKDEFNDVWLVDSNKPFNLVNRHHDTIKKIK